MGCKRICVLVIYWCITNYTKTQQLKKQTLNYEVQEPRSSLAGWFWPRPSHEVAVTLPVRAVAISVLDLNQKFSFQAYSCDHWPKALVSHWHHCQKTSLCFGLFIESSMQYWAFHNVNVTRVRMSVTKMKAESSLLQCPAGHTEQLFHCERGLHKSVLGDGSYWGQLEG